jgi:glutaminyl-tRNA synthetase
LGKNPADGRKVKGVIHFTEKTTAKPCEFRIYDRLFEMEKPSDDDKFKSKFFDYKKRLCRKKLIHK